MNFEKVNSLVSLLANVGVLAGILFLAAEISQNTNMMRSQTRDAVAEKQADYFFTIASNLETAALVRKGSNGYRTENADFLPDERTAFFYLIQGVFRIWENEFYQFQSGLFEEAEFVPRTIAWQRFMASNAGVKEVWLQVRDAYSPNFIELVDGLME